MSKKKIELNHLKRYRLLFGYSQKQIAQRLGLTSTTLISRWEQGEAYPDLQNAMKLSCIYKTLIDQLFPDLRREIINELTLKDINAP